MTSYRNQSSSQYYLGLLIRVIHRLVSRGAVVSQVPVIRTKKPNSSIAELGCLLTDSSRYVNCVTHVGFYVSLFCKISKVEVIFKITMRLYQALLNGGNFRTVFDFGGREVAHWFPGHMAKGDTQLQNV